MPQQAPEWADDTALASDREHVWGEVIKKPELLQFASEELKGDRDFIKRLVAKEGKAIRYASDELKADGEVVMEAVSQCPKSLEHVADELKADREIVQRAIAGDGWALQFASNDLKADQAMWMAAVAQKPKMVNYMSGSLAGDPEILANLRVEHNQQAFKVVLLSGRCCGVIIDGFLYDALDSVKTELLSLSARQLGQDVEEMCKNAKMMFDGKDVDNLKELPFGQLNEVMVIIEKQ